jgi:hypothetical protein
MIHFVEGQAYLGDQPVETKFGNFPEVKENAQLRTEDGRAEVLLTPGVFMRLGENSSFRMITNRLIDTRLELLSGTAIIEAEDIAKDNSVTVVYKDASVHVAKKGLYRFEAASGELKVFDGDAEVTAADKTVEVKESRLIELNTLAVRKFDKNETDSLDRWSARRGEYVAMANVAAANSIRTSMFSGGSLLNGGMYGNGGLYGNGLFNGGWFFNPYFGMYSYVPGLEGAMYSPYGYRFWSPFNVYMAYTPGYYYYPSNYGSGGYNNAQAYRGTGYSATPTRTVAGRNSPAIASGAASRGSSGSGSHGFGSVSSASSSAPVSRGVSGGGASGGPRH